jgi:branched-chain amino acid transport system ATP-binding protein
VILKTEGLSKDFGSLRAVNDVSLEIKEGTIRAIIGPNGAGKTTLFDLITNRTRPTSGKVYFQEKDITYLPPYKIVKLGIGKCFQISKLFPGLSVFENIQIACISRAKKVFNMYLSGNKAMRDEALQIINSIGLVALTDVSAGYLSYGDQRRLEIGITLALQPTLLMLDEPTAGVSRTEGYEVMKLIKELASVRALTIVFIEHDMDIVFNYAEEITVMHQGTIIATGAPEAIKSNKKVQSCYLGEAVC